MRKSLACTALETVRSRHGFGTPAFRRFHRRNIWCYFSAQHRTQKCFNSQPGFLVLPRSSLSLARICFARTPNCTTHTQTHTHLSLVQIVRTRKANAQIPTVHLETPFRLFPPTSGFFCATTFVNCHHAVRIVSSFSPGSCYYSSALFSRTFFPTLRCLNTTRIL